jgi:transcription-repair coupling factor (superfamily II helicase)
MSLAHLPTVSRVGLAPVVEGLAAHAEVDAWLQAVQRGGAPGTTSLRTSASILPALIAALRRTGNEPLLVAVESDGEAEKLAESTGWYLGEELVGAYPSRGVLYGAGVTPSPSRVAARECAREIHRRGGVVFASVAALAERIPPEDLRPGSVRIEESELVDRDKLVERLVGLGYERVHQVDGRGQIAVRGDVVDVFPAQAAHPVRIDWFDDEIEQIRRFSAYTQRTLERVKSAEMMPVVEIVLDGTLGDWWAEHDGGDPVIDASGDSMERAIDSFGGSRLLLWQGAATRRALDELLIEVGAHHNAVAEGYEDEEDLAAFLGTAIPIDSLDAGQTFRINAEAPAFGSLGFAEAEGELHGLVGRGLRVVVAFHHLGDAQRTGEKLKRVKTELLSEDVDTFLTTDTGAWLATSSLVSGFVSRQLGLAVVPSSKLFRKRIEGDDKRKIGGTALAAFTSLRVGDYVVHEDHGIARFSGFETKEVAGVTRDYLYLEFQGSDRLYVPHEQMGKVTRYVGSDGSAPALSKMGGARWNNLRNRARKAVRELAGELLALYAKRARAVGVTFPEDDELVQRFEMEFPHEETDDQIKAITAVSGDMERAQPMDRLICGDVGFGKTEVAMRAAIKAVAGGKQVMVLVPTTILASQHLGSFRERIGELPIEVEMVSRFRSKKAIEEALTRFRHGKVDILIGTHRLLSRDVLPNDLGLVIVDEEQRFGVAQKELLRQMRLEVDVLALSATPIPRTLHMSLAGIRDISVIETPPRGRQPIDTHVGEYDEELVRIAIERELDRDGQVLYLHNRVETIDEAALRIGQIVPRARVTVGHGQMAERQLEQVMAGFVRRDQDVLVATTIIESGLDIPTANTLIIERADMLGLSQLHQIRGRVGRSSRSAHAYLFYPSSRELSEEARARLTTLSDYSDLGAGARIALRDLELRGAGNLLGDEQSGHVAAIGFELYVEMLAEAVAELSGEPIPADERIITIDAKVSAYVPAEYVASEAIKIDVHRRVALAKSPAQLDSLLEELEDRLGEVPEPVQNLVTLSKLRILALEAGADRVTVANDKVVVAPIAMDSREATAFRQKEPLAVYSASRSEVQVRVPDKERRLERAHIVLSHLSDVIAGS